VTLIFKTDYKTHSGFEQTECIAALTRTTYVVQPIRMLIYNEWQKCRKQSTETEICTYVRLWL